MRTHMRAHTHTLSLSNTHTHTHTQKHTHTHKVLDNFTITRECEYLVDYYGFRILFYLIHQFHNHKRMRDFGGFYRYYGFRILFYLIHHLHTHKVLDNFTITRECEHLVDSIDIMGLEFCST